MTRNKKIITLSAILAGVGLFIFDELLFGTPVLILTKLIGAWSTFFILTPIYFVFDFGLGTITLNGVKHWKKAAAKTSGPANLPKAVIAKSATFHIG